MWKSVRSHLGHLMKNPPPDSEIGSGAGYYMAGPYLNASVSLKFDAQTPPPGGSTWSPSQMGQAPMAGSMDQGYGFLNGGNQYSMATGHRPVYATAMPSADSSSGRVSDVDSPPEKRQRLNQAY